MTKNWKLTLAYDGAPFCGWQMQPERTSVQGTLSDAIAAVAGERVVPQGAGRTDAGVHAAGQVASFLLSASIPPDNFLRALNRVLPPAVRVLAAENVAPEFHARHSAIGKIYRYRVFQGGVCSPFLAPTVVCSRWPLDLDAMQRAAQEILGEHDFTSFAASDPDRAARLAEQSHPDETDCAATVPGNVRRIEVSRWSCAPLSAALPDLLDVGSCVDREGAGCSEAPEGAPRILTYTVRGNGFLHHMVRNLVGTFLEVGRGRMASSAMEEILRGRSRALAGPTAPARGLCLMKVIYGKSGAS